MSNDALTYEQARDKMYQHFLKVLRTNSEDVLGYIPFIKWPYNEPFYNQETPETVTYDYGGTDVTENVIEKDGKPNNALHWVRVQMQPIENKKLGHKTSSNAYYETGMLSVEWFAPKSPDKAEAGPQMELMAQIIRNRFRGKRIYGSLYFKSAISMPLDPTENSYRFKTIIEYRYLEAEVGD